MSMDKLIKATAVAVVLFFVILAVVIGSRIDQITIALLAGVTVGLLVATPCTALVTYLAMRQNHEVIHHHDSGLYYGAPLPPSAWPGVLQPRPTNRQALNATDEPFTLPPRRHFYL